MNGGHVLLVYAAAVAVMSVVSAVLIVWDKHRARRNGWRVSERTLHTCEALGGWPGSWLARRWARHKTYKRSYRLRYGLIVLVHVTVFLGCVVWFFTR